MQNQWQLKRQAESVEHAEQAGAEWTGFELSVMADMKAQGKSVSEIAARLQRSYYAVSTKLQAAGLAQVRRSGAETPVVACADCWMVHAGECR